MSNRIKMIVGGICNLIVLVTFALILVVLSENRLVHRVLAASSASGSLSELNSNRVVLTTQDAGSFVGKKELVAQDDPNEVQRTFFAFRGIPYASPPIGELRWAMPEPVELKSTPHQAAEFKPPCSQWSPIKKKVVGAPDCLYLNIYTNYIPSSSKRRIPGNLTSWTVENPNLLPVLVYIHGGEFISGSASKYSPDALMKRERVVLVTFNYRLGVLGFLSSGNEELPGNYGLMDQLAALRWIQKYIHRFGGNPLRVTVFGFVEYLLLANSFHTTGGNDEESQSQANIHELFSAAILKPQSTSILTPFTKVDSREGARNFLRHLADNVGCSGEASTGNASTYALIDCLRKADTDTLIRSQTKLQTFHNLPFPNTRSSPLGPVVDHFLLDDEPENLFTSGRFVEVPLMVGLSANEGFNMLLEFYLKLYRKNVKNDEGGEKDKDIPEEKHNLTSILVEEDVKIMLQSVLKTAMVATPDMDKDGAFERVFQSVWNYYFGGISSKSWGVETEQVVSKLLRLLGDMFVNTGHCKLLHSLSTHSKAPVYSYVFGHGSNKFAEFFKAARETYESSEGMMGPKRPKRSLHTTLDTPWDETYYLFHPIKDEDNFPTLPDKSPLSSHEELAEDDRSLQDTLAASWVSFAKNVQPSQAMREMADSKRWIKMEHGHRSLNYYLISNQQLQQGMRSDFRKAECQFWMGTVPQVRKLSKVIQELEPFPILFWSSVAVVVLFALIIITLIVLIVCAKHRTGSYGGEGIYLHSTRHL